MNKEILQNRMNKDILERRVVRTALNLRVQKLTGSELMQTAAQSDFDEATDALQRFVNQLEISNNQTFKKE